MYFEEQLPESKFHLICSLILLVVDQLQRCWAVGIVSRNDDKIGDSRHQYQLLILLGHDYSQNNGS